jgi:hypothetical protein
MSSSCDMFVPLFCGPRGWLRATWTARLREALEFFVGILACWSAKRVSIKFSHLVCSRLPKHILERLLIPMWSTQANMTSQHCLLVLVCGNARGSLRVRNNPPFWREHFLSYFNLRRGPIETCSFCLANSMLQCSLAYCCYG